MATDNKGVMIYLPKDLEEYITNFCTQYEIVRKDKAGNLVPSLGTGVITYLKKTILGELPDRELTEPIQPISNGLNEREVLDLIDRYLTSKLPSNNSVGMSNDRDIKLLEERISKLEARIGDRDSLDRVENVTQQDSIELDVPSREEFERLEQALKQLKQDFIKSLY
jgi:BMFP domain-containing protein YqiC